MAALLIVHWIITLIALFVFLFPAAKIISKAGYNGWWCLLGVVPVVNVVMIWVFAFSAWPALQSRQSQ